MTAIITFSSPITTEGKPFNNVNIFTFISSFNAVTMFYAYMNYRLIRYLLILYGFVQFTLHNLLSLMFITLTPARE